MPRLLCSYNDARDAARKKLTHTGRTGEDQYEIWIDGLFRGKVSVPVPHKSGTDLIRDGTLKSMVRQLMLDRDTEFPAWRDCPMSRAQYEQLIRKKYPAP